MACVRKNRAVQVRLKQAEAENQFSADRHGVLKVESARRHGFDLQQLEYII